MKTSENISEFLEFIKNVEKEYISAQNELEFLAKEEIDLKHEIEFAQNRRKASNASWDFHLNQVDRRYNKDKIMMLEPIIRLLEQDKKTFDRLRAALGEVRKNENFVGSDRKYFSRVEQYYGKKKG